MNQLFKRCVVSIIIMMTVVCVGIHQRALAQTSSGQSHVIDGQTVFCETKISGQALVVVCQSAAQDHLVIVQRADGLQAFPLTAFGRRINQAAYRYPVADAIGAQNAEQLFAALGL